MLSASINTIGVNSVRSVLPATMTVLSIPNPITLFDSIRILMRNKPYVTHCVSLGYMTVVNSTLAMTSSYAKLLYFLRIQFIGFQNICRLIKLCVVKRF